MREMREGGSKKKNLFAVSLPDVIPLSQEKEREKRASASNERMRDGLSFLFSSQMHKERKKDEKRETQRAAIS